MILRKIAWLELELYTITPGLLPAPLTLHFSHTHAPFRMPSSGTKTKGSGWAKVKAALSEHKLQDANSPLVIMTCMIAIPNFGNEDTDGVHRVVPLEDATQQCPLRSN